MSRAELACRPPRAQAGAALLVALSLIGVVAGLTLLWVANSGASEAQRAQKTAEGMGIIRDALVARAAGDFSRPGSLPCPDYDDDGVADGSLCTAPYLGRVPWKTLDLPDLRDGAGERFWYALSRPFRDHPNACSPSPCVLNSDTAATLTINGAASQENVAIIIAPGPPLGTQNRDPTNPANLADPAQYLEGTNVPSGSTDQDYQAGPATDTFNDQALVITRDMVMPTVEQRVARQALRCLENFSTSAAGHYPFAAAMASYTTYADTTSSGPPYATTLYGRIPSTLTATGSVLGTSAWPEDSPQPDPSVTPSTACFASGTWWDFWRELLLYRVSAAYAPNGTGSCATDPCLTVNSQTGATQTGVKFLVIVAGRQLSAPSQSGRTSPSGKATISYYLEAAPNPPTPNFLNFSGSGPIGKRPRMITAGPLGGFNDRVECMSEAGTAPCN